MSFEVCLVCISKSLQLVKLVRTFSDVFKHSFKISGILYAFLFELQFVICSRSFLPFYRSELGEKVLLLII